MIGIPHAYRAPTVPNSTEVTALRISQSVKTLAGRRLTTCSKSSIWTCVVQAIPIEVTEALRGRPLPGPTVRNAFGLSQLEAATQTVAASSCLRRAGIIPTVKVTIANALGIRALPHAVGGYACLFRHN